MQHDAGRHRRTVRGRSPAQSVWYWAGALLAIYLVVLAIVVAAR